MQGLTGECYNQLAVTLQLALLLKKYINVLKNIAKCNDRFFYTSLNIFLSGQSLLPDLTEIFCLNLNYFLIFLGVYTTALMVIISSTLWSWQKLCLLL